jgi:hypothetical protein
MVKSSSNGADAERRNLEKQQAKRNKRAKQDAANAALRTRDFAELERDVRKLEREHAQSTPSKSSLAQLAQLRSALDEQRAAKAQAEQERLAKHKRKLAKKGLKPQDSPYYDAVSNPWGLPPLESDDSGKKRRVAGPGGAQRKPPRPAGEPPAIDQRGVASRFIPPMPSEPWPQDAAIVPHPRQDLIEKESIDRMVRESERQFRQAERIAARSSTGGAGSSVPTRQELLRRQVHEQVHQPVPAAADVRVDPAALRMVPTALRVKRDSTAVVASSSDAMPPKKAARQHEPAPTKNLDAAFASFMDDIDKLNS